MELKKIRNLSQTPQWVVWKGKQIVIPGGETADVDVEIAKLFMKQHEGLIEETIDIGSVYNVKADRDVWVANVTGDLDASPTVKVKRSEKGRWYEVDIPNPLKDPYTVQRVMKGGMKEVIGKSGLEALNLLPVTIKVPPYKRVKLPPHVAKWFMQRVAMSGVRDCIKSRAPSAFEPDASWAIDDLRIYLELIDPNVTEVQKGPSEKKIRGKLFGTGKGAESNKAKILREHKERLLKRIFRRVFDTKYRLPTKEEFEAVKLANSNKFGDADPEDATENGPALSPPAEGSSSTSTPI